jgi:para-nitrobenzyl esterase
MSLFTLSRRGVLISGAGLLTACATTSTGGENPVVETTAGSVRGFTEEGVKVFKGVRYGAPTKRFQRPEAPTPWAGVVDALDYGTSSPQMSGGAGNRLLGGAYRSGERRVEGGEDCLFLNVWTPAIDNRRRPVMFWMHGGGFTTGSGSSPWYDGVRQAQKNDMVVVTINHRLNVFGYTYLNDLTRDDRFADAGNVGSLDCVLALEWVRDNIANFGGDPNRVMIHGQSGGGAKTSVMLAMESGAGLYHRAVVQSGSSLTMTTPEEGARRARNLMNVLGLENDVEALASMPYEDLERATEQAGAYGPVVDGRSLIRHPFEPNAPAVSADIPVMIGTTRTEQSLFMGLQDGITELTDAQLRQRIANTAPDGEADNVIAMYRSIYPGSRNDELLYMITTDSVFFTSSTIQAARKAAQPGAPAYYYQFYWETPVDGGRFFSPHAAEIPFVFDTLRYAQSLNGVVTPQSQALADQMSTVWANFARNGVPTAPGLPEWPEYDTSTRPTMIFDVDSRIENDPRERQRRLFTSYREAAARA